MCIVHFRQQLQLIDQLPYLDIINKISIVRLLCISETHAWFWRAVSTVRCCLFLCGMAAKREGAKSASRYPCNHLSVQNIVPAPFPTSVIVATVKNTQTWSGTYTSKLAQGRRGSVFLNQSQRVLSAQPSILRFEIPRPPISMGRHTLSQATRQCPIFASL
jgi:hypothetical protein